MQESNLRLPKGAPDRGTATGNAGEPPQDLSLCHDPKGHRDRGQSMRAQTDTVDAAYKGPGGFR